MAPFSTYSPVVSRELFGCAAQTLPWQALGMDFPSVVCLLGILVVISSSSPWRVMVQVSGGCVLLDYLCPPPPAKHCFVNHP